MRYWGPTLPRRSRTDRAFNGSEGTDLPRELCASVHWYRSGPVHRHETPLSTLTAGSCSRPPTDTRPRAVRRTRAGSWEVADIPGAIALREWLLPQRSEGLLGHLNAHRGRDGGAGLQELVLELGGELAQATRFRVLGGCLSVQVLGDAF